MKTLTGQERAQLRASLDRARTLAASINLLGSVLSVTSSPAIQLRDEELVRQGILAEFTNQRLSDIIQAKQSASYETSLTMRSIFSMFNYMAMWAHLYDVQVTRGQLAKYDLKQFSNLEHLRNQLIEDTRGKLFWNQYWKAGIVACILVGASGMAIFTAGFGAPVSAFLAAQFTAYPTIATTVAAGGMLVLTSSIMCLHSSVRKAFRALRGLPATSQLPHAPLQQGGISTQQSLRVRDAAQPESALQSRREISPHLTSSTTPGTRTVTLVRRRAERPGKRLHRSGAQHITIKHTRSASQHSDRVRASRGSTAESTPTQE